MSLNEAFEVVLDLAGQNVLELDEVAGTDAEDERDRQLEALRLVEDAARSLGVVLT